MKAAHLRRSQQPWKSSSSGTGRSTVNLADWLDCRNCSRLADWPRLRPIGRLDWPSWPVQSGLTSNRANLGPGLQFGQHPASRHPSIREAAFRRPPLRGFPYRWVSGGWVGKEEMGENVKGCPNCGAGHDWLDWLCPIGSLAAALDWHVFWWSARLPDWCCSIAARLL